MMENKEIAPQGVEEVRISQSDIKYFIDSLDDRIFILNIRAEKIVQINDSKYTITATGRIEINAGSEKIETVKVDGEEVSNIEEAKEKILNKIAGKLALQEEILLQFYSIVKKLASLMNAIIIRVEEDE